MKEKIEEGSTSWQMLAYFHCVSLFNLRGWWEKRDQKGQMTRMNRRDTASDSSPPYLLLCANWKDCILAWWPFCYIHRSRLTKSRAQEVNRKLMWFLNSSNWLKWWYFINLTSLCAQAILRNIKELIMWDLHKHQTHVYSTSLGQSINSLQKDLCEGFAVNKNYIGLMHACSAIFL